MWRLVLSVTSLTCTGSAHDLHTTFFPVAPEISQRVGEINLASLAKADLKYPLSTGCARVSGALKSLAALLRTFNLVAGRQVAGLATRAGRCTLTVPSAPRVYFDVSAGGEALGRLTVRLLPEILPRAVENVRLLATGEQRSIDERLTYRGCAFDHSPAYVAGPQYKWAHILRGRGRNCVKDPLFDSRALLAGSMIKTYGGIYYGPRDVFGDGQVRTVVTIPVTGPSRGSSSISFVRVVDSPPAWRETLLLNSCVVGVLEEDGEAVLERIARSRVPPVVEECGELS